MENKEEENLLPIAHNGEPADEPDLSGPDRAEPDQTGPVLTRPDLSEQKNYRLTVSEAAALFIKADMSRNKRSIRRYCDRGDLDCRKVENANHNPQYFIDEKSIEIYIEQQKQLSHNSKDNFAVPIDADEVTPMGDRTGPDQPTTNKEEIIDLLKEQTTELKQQVNRDAEQLNRKDQQISSLNQTVDSLVERNRETNILLAQLHEALGTKQLDSSEENQQ